MAVRIGLSAQGPKYLRNMHHSLLTSASLILLIPAAALRLQPDDLQFVKPNGAAAAIYHKSMDWAQMQVKDIIGSRDKCKFKIHPPSSEAYDLSKSNGQWFSQVGQDKRLAQILNGSTGFFIESGAADGETNSNSLHFEQLGWTGLLVEPSPNTFPTLLKKHRKAFAYNGALSVNGEAGKMYLKMKDCGKGGGAGLKCEDCECSQIKDGPGENVTEIEVAPVADLLACLEKKTVDFWSLDVEGVEAKILETFPFETFEVGMMVIEMNKNEENNEGIERKLFSHNFKECGRTAYDRIYVNPSYFSKRGFQTPKYC